MVKTQSKQSSQAQQATTAGSSTPAPKSAGASVKRTPTKQELEILYKDPKIPVQDIADYFGITKAAMYNLVDKYGIPHRDKKHKYVTKEDRRKIIIEYTLGADIKSLAKRYDYHASTIGRITSDVRRPSATTKKAAIKVEDTVRVKVEPKVEPSTEPVTAQPVAQPPAQWQPEKQSVFRRFINWLKI